MKKTTEKKNHGNAIIMHLKRHHRKYLFGAFGGFAIVKAILLFFGLGPVLNIGNIFAGSEDPIILNASNFNDYCSTGYAYESSVDITCTGGIEKVESGAFSEYSNIRWLYLSGNNISEIEAGAFSGLTIETLDLSYNKLSNIDFEVFSGSTITTLDISHNQIYEVSNPETINNTTVDISYNCLPNSMIDEIENKTGEDYQYVCLYVEYSPNYWTNSGVQATLSVTGNDDIVSEISSLTTLITFDDNGTGVINFDDAFLSYSGDILNYPEDSQIFPAYVNWIDKTEPTCGERDYTPSIEERSTGITATLYGSYDNDTGAGIDISGGICLLTENETPCEVEISDLAGNTKKCYTSIPNKIDNTKPTCERSGLSTDSLEMGQTGNITLRCTDNLAGIQTMNITSGDISFSSGGVLQINNISTGSITGGVKYDIEFQAIGSGTTTLTLNANSVLDNANNGNQEGMPSAEISVHDEQQEPTGPLVYFEKQPSGNWSQSEEIIIHLQDGVTGCYRYQVNTGGSRQFGNCQYITGSVTLNITGQNRHSGYICVLWQSGTYTGFVCSNYPVRVDRSNPNIELLGPVNGTSVYLGDTITLSWTGSDNESGLSGYKLTIQEPNNNTGFSYYNSGETSTGFTVDQTGTRFWSVTAYDNVGRQQSSGVRSFKVVSGDDSPEILGDLVYFDEGKQPDGSWVSQQDITIVRTDGATGCYSYQTSTGTFNGCEDEVYSGTHSFTIDDESYNDEYICASWQSGAYTGFVCTNYPVQVDTIDPTCGTWNYGENQVDPNLWYNHEITATLSGSTDEGGSQIFVESGDCTIESGENSTCTVTISDNAGNTTGCMSSGFNIDTQAPTITLDNQSGTASNSHSVEVTITDDIAGFEENSSIRYKWQIDENSCDTDNYDSEALSNSGGALEITTTISTNNLSDGAYYLCISGAQDQAGNQSEATSTEGVFIVDNTAPICERSGLSTDSLEMGETGTITLRCTDNLAGIQTMNITSGNISDSSGGVLQINNISTGSITGGVMYNIKFEAIGSGITTLTLNANSVKDNANNGNPAGIPSDEISVTAVIDTQAPTISFNKTGGSPATGHEVIVTATDNGSKLAANQKIQYKRSTSETCGTEGFTGVDLTPAGAGSLSATVTITTNDLSDGDYYLCILSGTVEDQAGNKNEATRTQGVFTVDNTKPICERSGLSTDSLEMGETGNITLRCTDNLAGIQTMNLTSGDILFSSVGVLQINNISTGSITSGVMYNIKFEAIGSGTTTLTLKTNRVKDNANNGNPAGIIFDGISVNDNNGNNHNSPENPIEISGLVTIDGPSGNRVNQDTVKIHWNSGATGGYLIKHNKISDIQWNNVPYTGSNGGSITLTFTEESTGNRFICAFGQTGGYITSICSDYPVRIDRSNPNIQLLGPANGTNVNFGGTITLSWNGSDGQSGISGYVLKITTPSRTYSFTGGINFTGKNINLNITGNRSRSVTAYDKVAHDSTRTGTFVVQQNGGGGDTPVHGALVYFGRQPNGNWTGGETIIINWNSGATGGYRYQTSTNYLGSQYYTGISSGSVTLNITNENSNGKYICAFGQTGGYTGFICSTYPVKVDVTNPNLSLIYPSLSYDFKKGGDIRFAWSGSDDKSGISGYVFDVVSPSGLHDPHNFGPNTTEYTKTLNETGRRYWYVTGYDNINHWTFKSGSFYVSEDGDTPENGFYLVSPALGAQISLGNDVVLSGQPGTVNSGYNWTIKQISGTTIAAGTTTGLTVTISGSKFTTGAYSRSVKDIATDTTKSIALFYVVDGSDTPDLEVNQFEFNEIENADLDEYYSSNRITTRGLSDDWYTLAYLGSGIGALYINGNFVGTSGYVQNGDKIYIEMKASDKYNKTVKTTLFVGIGSNIVSGDFKITTKNGIHDWDDSSLTPMQKLWGVIYVDSLVEMYQYDEKKLATFLSTFMQLLQDRSDDYANKIQEAEEDGDEELAKEYKLYKEAIDFLYITVKYRYDNIDTEDRTVYIAPNGKQYLVEYDEDRRAYTSPDFTHLKYFSSWELFTHHIDMNNPAVGKWGIVGNVITTHNGKVYTIYETNGKWTSSNFKTAKYFDTKEDIINHILANNPASDWDHKIDTDFDEVKHTAPNGKVYKILKTSSKGNNPNMYTSYNFVNAKYFTSLEAAKKFINQNNPK